MVNPYSAFDAMQARLRVAAELYGLEDALFQVFIAPIRSIIVSCPGAHGRRPVGSFHRLPGAAQRRRVAPPREASVMTPSSPWTR